MIPASARRSARPSTSGASGPITTRSARSRTASAVSPSRSPVETGCRVASRPMPGLPGAACSSLRSGEDASFQASACSRPPDPIRRTRIGAASLLTTPRPLGDRNEVHRDRRAAGHPLRLLRPGEVARAGPWTDRCPSRSRRSCAAPPPSGTACAAGGWPAPGRGRRSPPSPSVSTARRAFSRCSSHSLRVGCRPGLGKPMPVPHTRAMVMMNSSALAGRASSIARTSTSCSNGRPSEATITRRMSSVDGSGGGDCFLQHRPHPTPCGSVPGRRCGQLSRAPRRRAWDPRPSCGTSTAAGS